MQRVERKKGRQFPSVDNLLVFGFPSAQMIWYLCKPTNPRTNVFFLIEKQENDFFLPPFFLLYIWHSFFLTFFPSVLETLLESLSLSLCTSGVSYKITFLVFVFTHPSSWSLMLSLHLSIQTSNLIPGFQLIYPRGKLETWGLRGRDQKPLFSNSTANSKLKAQNSNEVGWKSQTRF